MSDNVASESKVGVIEWYDLTVTHAEQIKNFYCDVVGWESGAISMGDYDDFSIHLPESNTTVAGICHARGSNRHLPAQWLMYVRVENVAESIAKCKALGGVVLDGPRALGSGEFCVIQDPEGAVLALVSN